ncbi:MAG: glycosyltransferase family 39 protein [Fimbriimonas ginsengisoli]|uniref:Glycosyltransferase family 39 protein n=1 Tax=Fimbriimonas ginsengisoli TaxID=1005039 RepID=A0A931LUT6_FIMGI|nr:glycosyltransferase family 39 protein [Fimbriimonas ginsengisoli]
MLSGQGRSGLSTRWIATFVLAAIPLLGWWLYGLFDVDEGYYGAVVAEMNGRHEWITPFYNGHPWFEKPILLYWLAKPAVMALGPWVGARLPSAFCTMGLFGVVAWAGARRSSPLTGQLAALVLASSVLVVGVGRMMMPDAALVLFLSWSLLLLCEGLSGDGRKVVWSGVMLGLAVLAKGPVALAIALLVLGVFVWLEPGLRPRFRWPWMGAILAFAVVVCSWYLPAYLANRQSFVQGFLIEQNLRRFSGGDEAHSIGWIGLLLYPLVLLVGMFPWSLWGPRALAAALARRKPGWHEAVPGIGPFQRFLAIWVVVAFLLFSLAGAKLPHYILPCCPPLALLIGERLARSRVARAGTTERAPPVEGDRAGRSTIESTPLPISDLPGFVVATLAVALVAHFGMSAWYVRSGQAELHAYARYLREQGGDVALYQMPRRQQSRGTLGASLQETSQPSTLLYLGRGALEAERFDQLASAPHPLWILTRPGRLEPSDFRDAFKRGLSLQPADVGDERSHYALYRLFELPKGTAGINAHPLPPGSRPPYVPHPRPLPKD